MEGQSSSLKVSQSHSSTSFRTASPKVTSMMGKNPHKRERTKEDFLDFCAAVLKYAKYQPEDDESNKEVYNEPTFDLNRASPINDSLESNSDSNSTDIQGYEKATSNPVLLSGPSEDEAITCFCKKPYAGRPMIECGSCKTWIHLSCAKIRRNHIPDVFICSTCRDMTQTSRKSTRVRTENKRFSSDL